MNELNSTDIVFIKGELRYKGAPEVGIKIETPLSGKIKELEEFNRSPIVDLAELYSKERNKSTKFLLTSKFQFVFKNAYSGLTQPDPNPYSKFNNNLFYVNEFYYKNLSTVPGTDTLTNRSWGGFPTYQEFTFLRTDNNIDGYTSGQTPHIQFTPQDYSYYNWLIYPSYCFENNYTVDMSAEYDNTPPHSFQSGQGIPYKMNRVLIDGKDFYQFTCLMEHGLNVNEYVELDFNYNGNNIFQVFSLGNGLYNTESKIFNVYDLGYVQNQNNPNFYNGRVGTFKRVIDSSNPIESRSEYYVRVHKILSAHTNTIVTNAGFENNPFSSVRKFYSAPATPNGVPRIATKENSQSYNVSLKEPLSIKNLLDNQKRPVSELFFTIVNRGYFGWFHPGEETQKPLRRGWEFNMSQNIANWWSTTNVNSDEDIIAQSYPKIENGNSWTFYFIPALNPGDTILGDFCEWNDMEQKERVISPYYHKFVFNQNNFQVTLTQNDTNSLGYYYKPHYKIQIRQYSEYIEEGNPKEVDKIPDYAFFSETNNTFMWRDLYDYGFVDTDNVGVEFPFMNGIHYPFENFIFRLRPEGNIPGQQINLVSDPTIDGCE